MVNTVTFTAKDGRVEKFPLSYLLEHNAIIATEIGGEDLSHSVGGQNQLWIASSTARLFIRDIVAIDFTEEENPPEVPSFETKDMQFANRPNISAKTENQMTFPVGKPIRFEGYADDYDKKITGIQFSLDMGETWTTYDTSDSSSDQWVYWYFDYTPEIPGSYLLKVRSVNCDGDVSPIAATHAFIVE